MVYTAPPRPATLSEGLNVVSNTNVIPVFLFIRSDPIAHRDRTTPISVTGQSIRIEKETKVHVFVLSKQKVGICKDRPFEKSKCYFTFAVME